MRKQGVDHIRHHRLQQSIYSLSLERVDVGLQASEAEACELAVALQRVKDGSDQQMNIGGKMVILDWKRQAQVNIDFPEGRLGSALKQVRESFDDALQMDDEFLGKQV